MIKKMLDSMIKYGAFGNFRDGIFMQIERRDVIMFMTFDKSCFARRV